MTSGSVIQNEAEFNSQPNFYLYRVDFRQTGLCPESAIQVTKGRGEHYTVCETMHSQLA